MGSLLSTRHLLGIKYISEADIQQIFETADEFKEVINRPIKKVPSLRDVTVANLFFENSTRTRISFELAEKRLSADVVNFSASSSSVKKGETLLDTVNNILSMKVDMVVMRHPAPGAPQFLASKIDANIINAGDGTHEHPTLAIEYAKTNCKLLLSARNVEQLEQVKAECVGAEQVEILPLDLLQVEASIEKAKSFLAQIGPIHTLINNAGISQRALVKDASLDIDRRIMEINFFAVSALTKLVLPKMLEKGEGQFVVMSSLVGKFGSPLRSAYAASKHALHGYYESLRAETHKQGIRVLIVCPGFIKTNISLNALTSTGEKQNKMDNKQAQGMLPEVLAHKIIQAVKRQKEEIAVGGSEKYGILVKRFFPRIFSRIIKKIKVT